MGTHQQLTTEQARLLILIKEIGDFIEEQPEKFEEDGGIGEVIVSSDIMTQEELTSVSSILERYGYIQGDYTITADGKQYVELLQKKLQEKSKEPDKSSVGHVSFSLINLEKLEGSIAKIDILGICSKLFRAVKG